MSPVPHSRPSVPHSRPNSSGSRARCWSVLPPYRLRGGAAYDHRAEGSAEPRMAERLVTSLAILKVNWDKGRDYIANYVPFVAECLRKAPQPEVSLANLQAAVSAEFGLKIPLGALKTVLRRAAKI